MRPSCFTPTNYDPHAPLRDPLSRRSDEACRADMVACMEEICRGHGQETVTVDDLARCGFTPGEIDRHKGAAVALLSARLRPRQVVSRRRAA